MKTSTHTCYILFLTMLFVMLFVWVPAGHAQALIHKGNLLYGFPYQLDGGYQGVVAKEAANGFQPTPDHFGYLNGAVVTLLTSFGSGGVAGKWQEKIDDGPWTDFPVLSTQLYYNLPLHNSPYFMRFLPDEPSNVPPVGTARPYLVMKSVTGYTMDGTYATTHFPTGAVDPAIFVDTDGQATISTKETHYEVAVGPPGWGVGTGQLLQQIDALIADMASTYAAKTDLPDIMPLAQKNTVQDGALTALKEEILSLKEAIEELKETKGEVRTIFSVSQETAEPNTRIYPNPTHRLLQFAGLSTTEQYTYHVYATSGAHALSGELQGGDAIDISTLAKGQYLFILKDQYGQNVINTQVLIR